MAHTIYVDLSAKVEHWTKASAVAASNDHCRVLIVTGKVKQGHESISRNDTEASQSAIECWPHWSSLW